MGRLDEYSDYETEVRQLIEDVEQSIRLSKAACATAQKILEESERLRVILRLEYHKRATQHQARLIADKNVQLI